MSRKTLDEMIAQAQRNEAARVEAEEKAQRDQLAYQRERQAQDFTGKLIDVFGDDLLFALALTVESTHNDAWATFTDSGLDLRLEYHYDSISSRFTWRVATQEQPRLSFELDMRQRSASDALLLTLADLRTRHDEIEFTQLDMLRRASEIDED